MVGTSAIRFPPARRATSALPSCPMSRIVCTADSPPVDCASWAALLDARGVNIKGAGMVQPHIIVFANEKGGTGKSTTAVHTAVALAAAGRRVAALDLDTRQPTLGRYLDNRAESVKRLGIDLVMPLYETFDPDKSETIEAQLDRLGAGVEIL